MADVNDKILDKTITDALKLQRLSASEREKIQKLLKKISSKLQGKMAELPDLDKMSDSKRLKTIKGYIKDCEKDISSQFSVYGTAYTKTLASIAVYSASQAAKAMNAAVAVDIADTVVLTAEQAQVLISESWLNGATVGEMLKKSEDNFVTLFKQQIREGYAASETNDQITRRLRGYTDKDGIIHQGIAEMNRRSAERMVRTSVNGIANEARWKCYESIAGVLQGVMWVATLDKRTCIECAERDGKMWDMNRQMVGGHEFPFILPPKHQNCRCTLSPITKSWGDIKNRRDFANVSTGTRASMNGQVPKSTDFEEWFGNQTAETQREILGKGRYDLWKSGKISFSELVDQNGRGLTVQELRDLD